MEADWSVELGAEDPVILVPWRAPLPIEDPGRERNVPRFVDLRVSPSFIEEIEEARHCPALRSALLTLNGAQSQLWTAKCDVWERSGDDEIDPLEMDAALEDVRYTAGSYIDILPRDSAAGESFALQERWIRYLAKTLHAVEIRCSRTDFVLRATEVQGRRGFGITWFVEACGVSRERARRGWEHALEQVLPTIMEVRWV